VLKPEAEAAPSIEDALDALDAEAADDEDAGAA